MDLVRHIRSTHYFAVTVGDAEPWVMKPSPGHYVPFRYGISSSGLAWFFDPKEGLFIYDVAARSLRRNLKLPPATDFNGKPSHDHSNHQMLQSPDGRVVYHLVSHGIRSVDLPNCRPRTAGRRQGGRGLAGWRQTGSATLCWTADGHVTYAALVGDTGRRDVRTDLDRSSIRRYRNGLLPGQQFQ